MKRKMEVLREHSSFKKEKARAVGGLWVKIVERTK